MSKILAPAVLHDGDYAKLQKAIEKGLVEPNTMVYDEVTSRLIMVRQDGTYSYVEGKSTPYVALSGTQAAPVQVTTLPDGMYMIDGYYVIEGVSGTKHSEIPIPFIITSNANGQNIMCLADSKATTYKVTEEGTTESTPVMDDEIDTTIDDKINENIEPASDDFIDSLFDNLLDGNGGD